MRTPAQAIRIYVGGLRKHGHRPLYEVIVERARKHGLAGATVVRGVMGYGASGRLRKARALRVVEDLPVVIEIVDQPERIARFLPDLDGLIIQGLVAIRDAQVTAYREGTTLCKEKGD